MSLTFAAVTCATSGTPRASVTMWCLDPALRRSAGFGPVFFPPAHRAYRPAVHHRPALVEPSRRRSSARRVSCKRRQTPARSDFTKRRQHVLPEPHPVSRGNICHGNPPRSTNRMPVSAAHGDGLRKQRLETRPQRIVQERLCHARPYQVDRASTRDQSEVFKRARDARQQFVTGFWRYFDAATMPGIQCAALS
jgi:hypothetical protein